jgi:hypothetical protein
MVIWASPRDKFLYRYPIKGRLARAQRSKQRSMTSQFWKNVAQMQKKYVRGSCNHTAPACWLYTGGSRMPVDTRLAREVKRCSALDYQDLLDLCICKTKDPAHVNQWYCFFTSRDMSVICGGGLATLKRCQCNMGVEPRHARSSLHASLSLKQTTFIEDLKPLLVIRASVKTSLDAFQRAVLNSAVMRS